MAESKDDEASRVGKKMRSAFPGTEPNTLFDMETASSAVRATALLDFQNRLGAASPKGLSPRSLQRGNDVTAGGDCGGQAGNKPITVPPLADAVVVSLLPRHDP